MSSKKRKSKRVNSLADQERDLFPMNFFGEAVIDYDEEDETVDDGWGQCEEDEDDPGWDS
jgi:hypothetical protein